MHALGLRASRRVNYRTFDRPDLGLLVTDLTADELSSLRRRDMDDAVKAMYYLSQPKLHENLTRAATIEQMVAILERAQFEISFPDLPDAAKLLDPTVVRVNIVLEFRYCVRVYVYMCVRACDVCALCVCVFCAHTTTAPWRSASGQ